MYRVGHRAPSVKATYLAAVFAAGDGAVLSGRAAAHLWGLVKGTASAGGRPAPTERRIEGVSTHGRGRLDPADVTVFNAIPITTRAAHTCRTGLGAARRMPSRARAMRPGVRYGVTPKAVEAVLASDGRTAQARRNLRRVMSGEVRVSLSKLESPLPRAHACREVQPSDHQPARPAGAGSTVAGPSIGSPSSSTATDSTTRATLGSRTASGSERPRARGDDFRRYTYHDVFEDPRPMLARAPLVFRKLSWIGALTGTPRQDSLSSGRPLRPLRR